MPKASPSQIAAKRKDYEAIKKLRKQAGKRAQGKPKSSAVYRDYKTVDRAYRQIGGQLGRMTGKKPRRGR